MLDRISERSLAVGLGVVGLAAVGIGTCAAYDTSGALPAAAPLPPRTEKLVVSSFRFKTGFYRAILDEDAKKLAIKRITPARMMLAQSHRIELTDPDGRPLVLRETVETESLRLLAAAERFWVGGRRGRYRARHLALRITNKTNRYLAYRVRTRVVGTACKGTGVMPHNAVALAPGETITRTECLLRRRPRLRVLGVEVLGITELGYHYLSRIDPLMLQIDLAAGHQIGKLGACKVLPWRAIRAAVTSQTASWTDVIDFYARHNCDEYTFFDGYRWSPKGLDRLPVAPPGKSG